MVVMNVKLLIVQGKPAGKSLLFSSGEYYIGRGPECHVRPNSDWVSRQHCLLRVTEDAVFIRDLVSCNGTLVNGTLLEAEKRLNGGDQIQIGPLVFEVQFEAAPPQPPDSAPDTVNKQAGDTAIMQVQAAEQPDLETEVPMEETQAMPSRDS
jgi:predicted component of type VI protein secretion system